MSLHRASRPRRRSTPEVPSLCVSAQRTVRFEEVDAVRFMWHGRYASWLEDGREAMGRLLTRFAPLLYVVAAYFSCFTLAEGSALVNFFGGTDRKSVV